MAAMAAERGGGSSSSNNNNNNNNNINFNNSNSNNGGRSLHNFSLPPCLSWGTQKLLRCSNSTSSLNDVVSHSLSSKRPRHSSPQYDNGGSVGGADRIDVVREKLMLDLRSEVDKMRAVFLAPPPPPPPRWNLRTRRAVCGGGDDRTAAVEEEVEVAAVAEERGDGGVTVAVAATAARPKFSVALTRQEVEEDFVAMVGRRPPRKPKKRPRYISKELETIFPGVWLSEVTADMYKVDETPEAPKVVIS
ncbi:hypothetical protein RND81_07G084600 [Saponaria officinalis]|uniref:DUF1639 family protein n=1 Tax=Saponaria officinalis TaxID=3572 RepID=A0AAW1JT47_SAPOF